MLTFFFLFHVADVAVALRNSQREEEMVMSVQRVAVSVSFAVQSCARV
jgi:hypothetical protein